MSWSEVTRPAPDLRLRAEQPAGLRVTIGGVSMVPTLHPGDQILVRARTPRIGEVILFAMADDSACIVHRVVFTLPGLPWLIQAGDANRHLPMVGVAAKRHVIGVACDLPRRLPSVAQGRGAVVRILSAVADRARSQVGITTRSAQRLPGRC